MKSAKSEVIRFKTKNKNRHKVMKGSVPGIPLEGMMGWNLKELNRVLFDRRRIDGLYRGLAGLLFPFFLVGFDEEQSTRVFN